MHLSINVSVRRSMMHFCWEMLIPFFDLVTFILRKYRIYPISLMSNSVGKVFFCLYFFSVVPRKNYINIYFVWYDCLCDILVSLSFSKIYRIMLLVIAYGWKVIVDFYTVFSLSLQKRGHENFLLFFKFFIEKSIFDTQLLKESIQICC